MLLFFGFLLVLTISVSAGDVYVSPDQPPEWYDATHVKTILEGITNSSDGDTIHIWNGTYSQESCGITVDKSVDIIGNGTSNTTVCGTYPAGSKYTDGLLHFTTDWINLSNVYIYYAPGYPNKGIYLSSNHTNISHCQISDCNNGILSYGNISNITIYDNTFNGTYQQYDICIYNTSFDLTNNVTISNNVINHETGGGGGMFLVVSNSTVSYNEVNGNNDPVECIAFTHAENFICHNNTLANASNFGIKASYCVSNGTYSDNNISNCGYGIYINTVESLDIYNITITSSSYGIYVINGLDYMNITNCNISDCLIGMFLYGSSYVNLTNNTIDSNDISS
jgi:parallel beta-helix repeat protein